jgi:hypothetical protein
MNGASLVDPDLPAPYHSTGTGLLHGGKTTEAPLFVVASKICWLGLAVGQTPNVTALDAATTNLPVAKKYMGQEYVAVVRALHTLVTYKVPVPAAVHPRASVE